jgi:hypothetical protein
MRVEKCPLVENGSVSLRQIELSDIEAWYEYLSMPRAVQHTSWNLKSAEDLGDLIEQYHSSDPGSSIRFAILEG